MIISQNQHGINTTGRGIRAVKIFTRQTLVGMSFRNILPYQTESKDKEDCLWDICSVASLSRNILEGYLSIIYYGTEIISEDDAEFRFLIGQFHRNREWYGIRKHFDPNDSALKDFKLGQKDQKEKIKNHQFISKLTDEQKNEVLKGYDIYKTKADFQKENKICNGLRRDYQLLSNLVHPLPLSIERIDNESGRGIGSDTDINYCILSLIIARRYLAASTIEIADFFIDDIGSKFKVKIDTIRPFVLINA